MQNFLRSVWPLTMFTRLFTRSTRASPLFPSYPTNHQRKISLTSSYDNARLMICRWENHVARCRPWVSSLPRGTRRRRESGGSDQVTYSNVCTESVATFWGRRLWVCACPPSKKVNLFKDGDWQVFIRTLGIQLITGPKEMQSPERFYDYAIYNGEQVNFSIWYNLVAQNF